MKINKKLLILIKIVLTIVFLFIVNRSVDLNESVQLFKRPGILLGTLVFTILLQTISCIRWFWALKLFGVSLPMKDLLKSYFAGNFFGAISPGRSGELLRVCYLPQVSFARSTMIILTENGIGFLVLLMAFFFWNPPIIPENETLTIAIAFIRGVAIIALLIVLLLPILLLFLKAPRSVWRSTIMVFLLSVAHHTCLVTQMIFLLTVIFPISGFHALMIAVATFAALPFMPIAIANIGVREFCIGLFAAVFLAQYPENLLQSGALSISLALLIFNVLASAVPGLLIVLFSGQKKNPEEE